MTAVFEAERPRLFAIAYRMLGSVAEAEDVLQEAWLAWQRVTGDDIEKPAAYLTTVVTRRCLDVLRSARVRREAYPGPWLPEPLLADAHEPSDDIELAESVRMAFLVVLESLSPAERAAFVLHDVFGYSHEEIAATLQRSEPACRQLVSRARAHLDQRRPRFPADDKEADTVAQRFLAAATGGDVDELLAVLHPDATLTSDGGGKVSAARRPLIGADNVARFISGVAAQYPEVRLHGRVVNGAPGAIAFDDTGTVLAVSVDIDGGLVRQIHIVRNPDKLQHLGPEQD